MYEIPKVLLEDELRLSINYEPNFRTETGFSPDIKTVYTKNIEILGRPIDFLRFVNIVLYLLNEFEDRISLSRIPGISFSEIINDFHVEIIDESADEQGQIIRIDNEFIWQITESDFTDFLVSGFHQLAYNIDHLHACRDKEYELFAYIE